MPEPKTVSGSAIFEIKQRRKKKYESKKLVKMDGVKNPLFRHSQILRSHPRQQNKLEETHRRQQNSSVYQANGYAQ